MLEEKCSSSASSLPSHRVTFNDKNEVASQDLDGRFTVTYSQLGERISGRKAGAEAGLRVHYSQRSNLEKTLRSPVWSKSLYRDIYSQHSGR